MSVETLSRWDIVQLARHPQRPRSLEYIARLFPDFVELHGDRVSDDDPAIMGGPTTLLGRPIMVVAHVRRHENGMARPAGFRKASRLVALADRLGLPILTLIDTPGAYPGPDAEEHGQAFAISGTIEALSKVSVPVVACVVGEGGSGGALALSVSDRLLMQEYAIFPVISPEACSSILYRDGTHAPSMAEALRLTARDLSDLHLVDEVISEPPGGAHNDPETAARSVGAALAASFDELRRMNPEARLAAKAARIRSHGAIPA